MNLTHTQYKEQRNALQKKDAKLEELAKLATTATEAAEKFKEHAKEKETQILSLSKHVEAVKKQLAGAQSKIKMLSGNIMTDMTKQLETKVKEAEMLKEMLRSTKIELAGKEKEIRYLRSKLSGVARGPIRLKMDRTPGLAPHETPQKQPVKSVSLLREPKPG